jgi:hypothetical protein
VFVVCVLHFISMGRGSWVVVIVHCRLQTDQRAETNRHSSGEQSNDDDNDNNSNNNKIVSSMFNVAQGKVKHENDIYIVL